MTYTAEQLKGLSPEGIATKCSPVHIENVIKDLIATALDLMQDAERYRYVRNTQTLDNVVWLALEGDGLADEKGELDQDEYARGLDRSIDIAIRDAKP